MATYKPNDGPVLAAVEDQIQKAFNEGFAASERAPNPYLYSSSCWIAFQAGFRWRCHTTEPTTCKVTRGHAVKLGDSSVYRLVGDAVIQTERGRS